MSNAIEAGMKVSVRRGVLDHIGVVTGIDGDYVTVRWTQADEWNNKLEFCALCGDVTPLDASL
jgi:hypothetical protein